METTVLELLNQADTECRKRIEVIKNPAHASTRRILAEVRMLIQEAINKLFLED